jgi:hypothetical protein
LSMTLASQGEPGTSPPGVSRIADTRHQPLSNCSGDHTGQVARSLIVQLMFCLAHTAIRKNVPALKPYGLVVGVFRLTYLATRREQTGRVTLCYLSKDFAICKLHILLVPGLSVGPEWICAPARPLLVPYLLNVRKIFGAGLGKASSLAHGARRPLVATSRVFLDPHISTAIPTPLNPPYLTTRHPTPAADYFASRLLGLLSKKTLCPTFSNLRLPPHTSLSTTAFVQLSTEQHTLF